MIKFKHALARLLCCALLFGLAALAAPQSASARFLQPDTWDPILLGVDINRYAYAGNDPINGSDPLGHQFFGYDGSNFGTGGSLAAAQQAIRALESNPDVVAGKLAYARDSLETLGSIAPVVSDGLAIRDAWQNPSFSSIGLAAAGLIPGVGEFKGLLKTAHHLWPRAVKELDIVKRLGIKIESPENLVDAYQNGFTKAHRIYNSEAKSFLSELDEMVRSGKITETEAKKMADEYQRIQRTRIEDNPSLLLGRSSEGAPTSGTGKSVDKGETRGNKTKSEELR
ncbi:hypothetical protein BH10PSE7_BH10PSE7_30130 [soil metagenome]